MRRIEALGRISEERQRLTRTFCSPAMRRANNLVAAWMRQAGMTVREDEIGNLIGRYGRPRGKVLLLGSHLDTVRDAGRFDGALGVILAISCVEQLRRSNTRLPFALEVIGFADEEGVRYQSPYLGSRVVAGTFARADLRRKDANGVTMAEAIRRFGGRPARLKQAGCDHTQLLGYIEAHIEQGPVLEQEDLAVGVVSAIAGQARLRFRFIGQAGHAGTTPMRSRRDALCAAAEFVLAVEGCARRRAGLVATVGQIQAEPNASNVIPGTVTVTLDVRHQSDPVRRRAIAQICNDAQRLCLARKMNLVVEVIQATATVPCSRRLTALLKRAAGKHQARVIGLPSGAGHDAAVLAKITPTAMLFVRCKGGISHHPAESVKVQDVRVAMAVMTDFLVLVASEYE
jgi:allantoate deiminase